MRKTGARERILKFLNRSAPEQFNSSTIALTLKIKKATAKRTLARLYEEGLIERPLKGFYRGKVTAERMLAIERTEIKLHGVKIEFQATQVIKEKNRFVPFRVEGISLCPLFTDKELAKDLGYKIVYKVEILNRLATIQIHRGKPLVEVWLKCSEDPLNFQEFNQFTTFLEGKLGDTFFLGEPELVQVGLNRDYEELRLEGCNSIKLQKWRNAWQQLYNKAERVLRHEIHINTRISLKEAFSIMEESNNRIKPELELKPQSNFHEYMYR